MGKGFSKFFNFFGNIFKEIFHFIILALIFLKSNVIKILLGGIILGLVGIYLDIKSVDLYTSKLIVQPNFESTEQLYKNIEYYNNLVQQNEYKILQETFEIDENESKSLVSFSINPIENGNDIINNYDRLVGSIDTLVVNNYSLKEFRENFTKLDYKKHEISVISSQNRIFKKLQSTIINSITKNEFFNQLKKYEKLNLERSYNLNSEKLIQADTLRKAYIAAIKEEAKTPSQVTSIDMGGVKNRDRELELFDLVEKVDNKLTNINKSKAVNSEVLNVISSFQNVGYKPGGILNRKSILFFLIGNGLVILFLIFDRLNKYLNNFKKE